MDAYSCTQIEGRAGSITVKSTDPNIIEWVQKKIVEIVNKKCSFEKDLKGPVLKAGYSVYISLTQPVPFVLSDAAIQIVRELLQGGWEPIDFKWEDLDTCFRLKKINR